VPEEAGQSITVRLGSPLRIRKDEDAQPRPAIESRAAQATAAIRDAVERLA
jgi:hypothetical protein